MKKYQDNLTVKSFECDSKDRMKADFVLKHMQEAATNQMTAEGVPYDSLLHQGIALVINRIDIDFLSPIMKFDSIVIQSWPCEGKGATLPRKYLVLDKEGKEVAKALGQWSLVDVKNKKIMRADAVDFSSFTTEKGNKESCERFKMPQDDEMQLIDKVRIRYNDVDCNGHLNNANYLRLVQDYIPELNQGGFINSAKIHFAKECLLGETIALYSYSETDSSGNLNYYFKTLLDDGTINCQIKIGLSV